MCLESYVIPLVLIFIALRTFITYSWKLYYFLFNSSFKDYFKLIIPHSIKLNFRIMDLTAVLFLLSLPFVALTVFFGTKNDFYESENYKGDGCAHDVKR